MGRIIVFTGKGGVGKSSIASAHAVKAAKEGKKTLVVSTDMAHNLSDIFMTQIKNEPVEVMDNLDALEIDPNHELANQYDNIAKAVTNLVKGTSKDAEDAIEDISVFPGSEELLSLIRINEIYESNRYDLIIVDCAPTGETLALLKFPELMSWYMKKLFPIGKGALKILRPISKAAFKIEMPDKAAMNDIERLYLKLLKLQQLLKNRDICSIRIVTIPEKMVVEETKRSYMYLNLYNFNVDALYINRIISSEVKNKFFDNWKVIQGQYLSEINDTFPDLKTYKIKWYETDLNGINNLERICRDSLADENIFKVLKQSSNEMYTKFGDGYKLKILVPFANKENMELYQSNSELIIKLRNFKRDIVLPDVIRKCEIVSSKLLDGRLEIIFK